MDTVTKRHPIRGFLYGILFGLGLMLIVVGQGMAALGTWPPFIVFVVGILIGTVWGLYGPAKGPKGPPPTGATVVDDEPPIDPVEPEPEPEPEPAPVPEAMASEDGSEAGTTADDAPGEPDPV